MRLPASAALAGVLALRAAFVAAGELSVELPVPSGETLLSRATALSLPLPQIAQAIATAPDLPAAKTALVRLQLAAPSEIKLAAPGGAAALRDSLQTLWGEASRHIKDDVRSDESWAVPAVVVKNGERSYYIHGLSHGFFYNLGRQDARRLAEQVKSSGAPLLVEQNFPQAYGLDYGREVVTSANDRYTGSALAARLFGRPAHWLYFKSLALIASSRGQNDFAGFMNGVAGLYGARHPRWQDARALELPLPLKASLEWSVVKRSRDLARAAREEAGKDVHILAGWAHVFDLVALLSGRA